MVQAELVVAFGVNPQLADVVRRHWGGAFEVFDEIAEIGRIERRDQRICFLVGVDVFDGDGLARLIATKQALEWLDHTQICAVTSFMPGAYREFTIASGADECLTEADILIELEQYAQR